MKNAEVGHVCIWQQKYLISHVCVANAFCFYGGLS